MIKRQLILEVYILYMHIHIHTINNISNHLYTKINIAGRIAKAVTTPTHAKNVMRDTICF